MVHGRVQFPTDGIRRLLPLTVGSGHQEATASESLRMCTANTVSDRYKDGVECLAVLRFFVLVTLSALTDFQVRVEAAVGGDGLGVRERLRHVNEGQSGEAGDLADTRCRAQDAYHFVARDDPVPGLPVHGEYLAANIGHITVGLGDILVVKHVFLPDQVFDVGGKWVGTDVLVRRGAFGCEVLNDGTYLGVLCDARQSACGVSGGRPMR